MDAHPRLDPHERPPEGVRLLYKKLQKTKLESLDDDDNVLDFTRGLSTEQQSRIRAVHQDIPENLDSIFEHFENGAISTKDVEIPYGTPQRLRMYEHEDCPGLFIIPSIIPLNIQRSLLDRLLHRDLVVPHHSTNVHLHHHLSYPESGHSFFSVPTSPMPSYAPKDPKVHSPLTLQSLLDRKMRWMTLGGQYDWTQKEYPSTQPPPFPSDIASMLHKLCPTIIPEAAICNLYTPGDTLSLHRDVSELCAAPLLSLSIGCDAIFVLSALKDHVDEGQNTTYDPIALRLHSGDLVLMTGPSRFAWHGIPKVIPDTCPSYLSDWPASTDDDSNTTEFEHWRGWMNRKRVNLNVRQMFQDG